MFIGGKWSAYGGATGESAAGCERGIRTGLRAKKRELMDKRIPLFNAYFAKCGIVFPPDSEERFPKGAIASRGWTIKFLFGDDEAGKYLDFYATHRMTNDRHLRLRANGDIEHLPAYPDVMQRWSAEHIGSVTKLLEAKGFGATGDEHASFLLKNYVLKEEMEKAEDNE